jgi:alpha-1,6-mannosyltransferase
VVRRGTAPVAAGAVALCLVAVCAAAAWPDDSTLVPRNAGRPTGDSVWAHVFLGCAAGAFLAYVCGVVLLARRPARLAPVAALAAAIQLVPLTAPLLLSTDAWTYWDQGRIAAVHEGNPYVDPPSTYPSDPAFPWVGEAWRDVTSVYGPGFTLASEPLALAAGSSEGAAAWLYKALGGGAVLVAVWLAARLSPRPWLAAAIVGWNPLLALHFAGGGHNDAWLAALVVAALALASRGRRSLAGAAWALAVLVKWIPLGFLLLRALEARATGRRVGHASFAVVAAAVLALATWRYGWHWLDAFGPLARNVNGETSFAIPHRLQQLGLPRVVALTLAAVAFGTAYLVLLRRAARGRARLGLTACAALLTTPYLAPWYVVWAVPLAAAEDDGLAQVLAVGISAYLLRQTIPL